MAEVSIRQLLGGESELGVCSRCTLGIGVSPATNTQRSRPGLRSRAWPWLWNLGWLERWGSQCPLWGKSRGSCSTAWRTGCHAATWRRPL